MSATQIPVKWIDAHTHLEMLEENTEQVIKAAHDVGVSHMITIGCHPNDFEKVFNITKAHYPAVAGTVGVHPHEAKFYTDDVENQMRNMASTPTIIGIGEIGLDYFYEHSPRDIQQDAFHKQMRLASELGLPVEIHSRDAEDDTIAELNKWSGRVTGMMHCFSGTEKLAKAALDVGFYISLSGVVTFKNADALREVIKTVPLNRILVETDAPFLAPIPMRGKPNRPAYVVHTAQKVAEIKQVPIDILLAQTQKNIRTLFPKWDL